MKKVIIAFALCYLVISGYAQTKQVSFNQASPGVKVSLRIGIIIASNDPETVWNAFRFGNFASQEGDSVSVFLLGKGVEAEKIVSDNFDVSGMMKSYTENGGKIFACGTCLRSRNEGGTELCPISTMAEMYEIVKQSDKLLTF